MITGVVFWNLKHKMNTCLICISTKYKWVTCTKQENQQTLDRYLIDLLKLQVNMSTRSRWSHFTFLIADRTDSKSDKPKCFVVIVFFADELTGKINSIQLSSIYRATTRNPTQYRVLKVAICSCWQIIWEVSMKNLYKVNKNRHKNNNCNSQFLWFVLVICIKKISVGIRKRNSRRITIHARIHSSFASWASLLLDLAFFDRLDICFVYSFADHWAFHREITSLFCVSVIKALFSMSQVPLFLQLLKKIWWLSIFFPSKSLTVPCHFYQLLCNRFSCWLFSCQISFS